LKKKTAEVSSKAEKVDEHADPTDSKLFDLTKIAKQTKKKRAELEKKRKTRPWRWDENPGKPPSTDLVEQLELQMEGILKTDIYEQFWDKKSFKSQLDVIEKFKRGLSSEVDEKLIIENFDIIVRWMTIKFYDKNPQVLLKCIELLDMILMSYQDQGLKLTDYETNSFLQHILNQIGNPKEALARPIADIITNRVSKIYPVSKIVPYLYPGGYKSKNARQRLECIKSISILLNNAEGYKEIFGPDPKQFKATLKDIANLIQTDNDRPTKSQILDLLVSIGKFIGKTKLEDLVGDMGGDKNKSMLMERIKHAPFDLDTPKKAGPGPKIMKPVQIREHQHEAAKNLDLKQGVESNSGGTLRRRHQLPSERVTGNLETPSESNFNLISDPHPLIPDEVKNDPQLLQIWKELGEDTILLECKNNMESIERDNNTLNELIGDLKVDFDGGEKFFDEIDQEVEKIYSALPQMTRKRLQVAEFKTSDLNVSFGQNVSFNGEQRQLGEKALKENVANLISATSSDEEIQKLIFTMKEMQAYFQNPETPAGKHASKLLAKNSNSLITGLTYQLKALVRSDQMTQANYDDDKIDQDMYLQLGNLLVHLLDSSLKSVDIIEVSPVEDLKDMLAYMFKIANTKVSKKWAIVQSSISEIIFNVIKAPKTMGHIIAVSVRLFREYCDEKLDLSGKNVESEIASKQLRRFFSKLLKNFAVNEVKTSSFTHESQEKCVTEFNDLYLVVDPKKNRLCIENQSYIFKLVRTILSHLVQGNPQAWSDSLVDMEPKGGCFTSVTRFLLNCTKNGEIINQENGQNRKHKEKSQISPGMDHFASGDNPKHNTARENEQLDGQLAKILGIVRNKDTCQAGLNKLYDLKVKNTGYNISLKLANELGEGAPLLTFVEIELNKIHRLKTNVPGWFLHRVPDGYEVNRILKLANRPVIDCPRGVLEREGAKYNHDWNKLGSMPYEESKIDKFKKFTGKSFVKKDVDEVISFQEKIEGQSLKIQKEIGIKSRLPMSTNYKKTVERKGMSPAKREVVRESVDSGSGVGSLTGNLSAASGLMRPADAAEKKREEFAARLQKLKDARMKLV
jgi:hypothetical protein